jgi:hypothetical protein
MWLDSDLNSRACKTGDAVADRVAFDVNIDRLSHQNRLTRWLP